MAKIMLVEDDNNLREIYSARLSAEGHEIVSAKDGEEALALAVKEKPDLVISDVMMPRISGFDMLDILRNAPETKNTKVIMMTALSQAEDKVRAGKLGADMYLVKSQVTLEDVAKAVNQVLSGTPNQTDNTPPPLSNDQAAVATDDNTTNAADDNASTTTSSLPPASDDTSDDGQASATQPTDDQPASPPLTPVAADAADDSQTPAATTSSAPTEADKVETDKPAEPQKIEIKDEIADQAADKPADAEPQEGTETHQDSTAPASEEVSAAAQPAPLEVVLPPTPAEDSSNTALSVDEAAEAEAANNNPDESDKATSEPDVGPNLAEVLTDEQEEVNPSENPPAAPPPAAAEETTTAPETDYPVSDESDPVPPAPDTDKDSEAREETEAAENLDIANGPSALADDPKKKVINPINDLTKKPDFDALLAKEAAEETANQAVPTPAVNSVIKPNDSNAQSSDKSSESELPKEPPADDISKIAL